MSSKLYLLILFTLLHAGIVRSAQQQQQQHSTAVAGSSIGNDQAKSSEPIVGPVLGLYNTYTRNNGPLAHGNRYAYQAYAPSHGSEGEVYGANPNPQVFGISSNGDFSLSAYFGPIFWGVLSGLAVVVLIIWLLNGVGAWNLFSNLFPGATREKGVAGKSGKSIDMDKLSAMVYTALDSYGKWKVDPHDKYV